MSKLLDKSAELRAIEIPHYNCAQSVLIPFAIEAEVDPETARRIAANFGGGMKRGSVCGAVTGGLMALGLFEADDAQTVEAYYDWLLSMHSGCLNCSELLQMNEESGGAKKPFCDGLVFECVSLVEGILKEKGRL